MDKTVRVIPNVGRWLDEKHDLVSYDWLISIVKWTPEEERKYYTHNRFTITVPRKSNSKRVRVIIRVEETETELVVLQAHLETSD